MSKVYMRTEHRHSMYSLVSKEDSEAGLSILSGISLAKISNLSVMSLPFFRDELWIPQQYSDSSNGGTNVSLSEKIENASSLSDKFGKLDIKLTGLISNAKSVRPFRKTN